MESEWHQEVTELTATMDTLIEENEQLRKRMDWQKSAKADADLAPSASGGAMEDGLLALTASMSTGSVSTYKEAIAKNKEEIRAKMRDIEELQLMLANVSDWLIDWLMNWCIIDLSRAFLLEKLWRKST